ncbi:energy transducer TonB [Phenylobacterium sp.]|uniref:energy transducer TonB n=1 Tax=Phenylobacterium sp. TaxID=1871053 RepID=UPI002F92C2F9
MVIRQAFPISLGGPRHKGASPLTVAVGFSIAVHVAIGAYIAMLKFQGPPPPAIEEPPIWEIPFVTPKDPPPPADSPQPPPPQTPPIHNTAPPLNPPIPPQDFAPPNDQAPVLTGPVTTFDPPVQTTPPAPPRDPIIRNPQWVRRPDAGDFARFYPERAMRLGREGEAEITCSVLASGQLRECRVTGEAPDNMGFGQAALKLARYLQIAPKTIDGKPVDGGILVVPIQFRLN